jgi:enoyl-CoA hydratase/carnithine racemase
MSPPPDLADARLLVEGGVATLVLDRDDVRNELTGTRLVDDLVRTVDWINADETVAALVITGAGRAFSSGGNVKHMRERSGSFAGDVHEVALRYRAGIQRMPLAMQRLDVPTIAAINGPAIGAGFDLACMCDIRLAANDAVMGETFIDVGIVPGDGGAWFLQRIVGRQRAAELTFSGRVFDAAEALTLGVVLEVAPAAGLLLRAQALGACFAAKSPRALRLAKRLLDNAQRAGLADHLDLCAAYQGICHNTDDHREAVMAMLDKRAPRFTGR